MSWDLKKRLWCGGTATLMYEVSYTTPYSSRKALVGSMRAAYRAGAKHAIRTIAASRTGANCGTPSHGTPNYAIHCETATVSSATSSPGRSTICALRKCSQHLGHPVRHAGLARSGGTPTASAAFTSRALMRNALPRAGLTGFEDGVSPEPIGRTPKEMPAEEAAKLGLDTTRGVMRKAGIDV